MKLLPQGEEVRPIDILTFPDPLPVIPVEVPLNQDGVDRMHRADQELLRIFREHQARLASPPEPSESTPKVLRIVCLKNRVTKEKP